MDYQLNGSALIRERDNAARREAAKAALSASSGTHDPAGEAASLNSLLNDGRTEPMPMVDPFHRLVTYLRISITDRCNLRCSYCMPEEGINWFEREDILSYEEILRIVSVASRRGLTKVRITGGEPLARKGVAGLIARLTKIDGLTDIALSTNATLLAEQAHGLHAAGLRRVNVSLDSLRKDRNAAITRRDCHDKVWAGLEAAERVGITPIKLNCVLMRGVNDDEVLDFARLTLAKSYHVRFIEYMPVNDWEDWRQKYVPMAETRDRITRAFGPLTAVNGRGEHGAGPAENFRLPGAAGVVGFITAVSSGSEFCVTCNRMRLTADGWLRPCLFSDVGVDFREPLRHGATDADLDALFDEALAVKPKDHELAERPEEKMLRNMVNIGG